MPIAAVIKLEANIPVCRDFVQGLYPAVQDMLKKTKHLPATLPLNAAILSLAQRDFFLSKWPGFLSTCLASLKHARVALQEVGRCTKVQAHTYTHIYMHTHVHTHTHRHICMRTRAHT